jgi:Flp pilus assembly protein TadG
MNSILKKLEHFHRNEQGVATLEFVIAFPFMFAMIVATFDAGLLMTKYVVLENSLDRVVRTIRLSGIDDGASGAAYFKTQVCSLATLIKDCESSLFIEMSPIDTSSSFTPGAVTCVDRTASAPPANTISTGGPNDIVYVRACLVVDRYFPSAVSGIFSVDASGGIQLIADSAYVVEPL